MSDNLPADSAEQHGRVFRDHARRFESNRFVYPVISRRSRGVSIGVNLNPDKVCNFDCIYCQVDRRSSAETKFVDMEQLLAELRGVIEYVTSNAIYQHLKFASTPEAYRRLNDIAFSGDGEPTTYRNFDDIIGEVSALRRELCPSDTRMVLITNASMFHREHVRRGLELLDKNNGQIWAKLDAGTDAYYRLIERTTIPFQQILDNITDAARLRPIVIQSLFMRVHGEGPSDDEIRAFVLRLKEIRAAGGQLEYVQIYTVARQPAETWVTALSEVQLNAIADSVRHEAAVKAEVYG